ncbi:MAG: hypothetical protein AAFP81_14950 [Pseudomonadota bacterium]
MSLVWLKKISNEAGNLAAGFVLLLIPIFAVGSFARHFQHTLYKKQNVQPRMDSAVFAAARVKPAQQNIDKIDVAFMLDVSGSLKGSSRTRNLQSAAKKVIEILLRSDVSDTLIKNTRLGFRV